jgi:anaerobic ribonucleoside-triphosphate reductase activating protein
MNYGTIKPVDIANGAGVRVALFVSGCTRRCPGCFNPETWDFSYGEPFTPAVGDRIMELLDRSYINGLSLLGGEPFEPDNQRGLLPLVRRVRDELPGKTVWAYTGYVYERDLCPGGGAYCEATDELLSAIDVLVDGPFIERRKNISLKFRGSDNQRLLDLPETRRSGRIILLGGNPGK